MLKQVTLKDGVEELGNYAFARCENLNIVYIFESLSNFSIDGYNLGNERFSDRIYFTGNGTSFYCTGRVSDRIK